MSSPLSDSARDPAVPSTDRRKVARKWAYQVRLTAYMPMPYAELEDELRELVDRIFEAMTSEPLPTDRLGEIGARLVDLNCVGPASLRTTIEVLAGALLADPQLRRLDRGAERVTHVLAALAAGYVNAVRATTTQQQDSLHRALLEAMWCCRHRLSITEARLAAVLAGTPAAVAVTNLDGRILQSTDALARLLTPTSTTTLFDLIHDQGGPDLRTTYHQLTDGALDRLTLTLDLPDPTDLTATLVRDFDGHPTEFVTVLTPAPPSVDEGHRPKT